MNNSLTEQEVRDLRDLVYGDATTDNNWSACGPRWMQPEESAFLINQALKQGLQGMPAKVVRVILLALLLLPALCFAQDPMPPAITNRPAICHTWTTNGFVWHVAGTNEAAPYGALLGVLTVGTNHVVTIGVPVQPKPLPSWTLPAGASIQEGAAIVQSYNEDTNGWWHVTVFAPGLLRMTIQNGAPSYLFEWDPGQNRWMLVRLVTLQRSSDLVNWTNVACVKTIDQTICIVDTNAPAGATNINYRVGVQYYNSPPMGGYNEFRQQPYNRSGDDQHQSGLAGIETALMHFQTARAASSFQPHDNFRRGFRVGRVRGLAGGFRGGPPNWPICPSERRSDGVSVHITGGASVLDALPFHFLTIPV